jgi:predicted metal-dependent HD superfamily phosphohydrolase
MTVYADPEVRSPLARAFDGALLAAGAQADGGDRVAAFVDLARRYSEPGRHYHTLRHVAETVAAYRLLLAAEHDTLEEISVPAGMLAVYYHDAVHETTANDNERRSAELAADVLGQLRCPSDVVANVTRLVAATARHVSTAPDEALVNDADLRVLARPAPAYDHYVRRVRLEYAWAGEADWATGRAVVLRRLLDGPIYATSWGARHWEHNARTNLYRELSALAPTPPDGPDA